MTRNANVLNDDELLALYEAMKEVEGPQMDFTVERDDSTLARQQGTTFSAEALERVVQSARVWLWTRCFRALKGDEATHQKLRVSVTIEIDDEQEPGVPVVMEVIDGTLRFKAVDR